MVRKMTLWDKWDSDELDRMIRGQRRWNKNGSEPFDKCSDEKYPEKFKNDFSCNQDDGNQKSAFKKLAKDHEDQLDEE